MFQLWDPNWIGTCFAVFICESANVGCWPGVVPCPSWDAAPSCGWSDQAIRGSFVKKLVKNPFQKTIHNTVTPPWPQIQWEFEGFLRFGGWGKDYVFLEPEWPAARTLSSLWYFEGSPNLPNMAKGCIKHSQLHQSLKPAQTLVTFQAIPCLQE